MGVARAEGGGSAPVRAAYAGGMARRDDDALSWGDDDPTLDLGGTSRAGAPDADPGLPPGYTAVGRGSGAVGRRRDAAGAPAPGEAAPTAGTPSGTAGTASSPAAAGPGAATTTAGNAALVGLGVVGGVYLLLAVGWLIGGLRLHGVAGYLVARDGVASPMWAAGTLAAVWLAVLAPLIWFVTVFVTTRRSRTWLRWVLLVAGVLLLLPWPFIMVGTVGA
jgi:hypothetical protein